MPVVDHVVRTVQETVVRQVEGLVARNLGGTERFSPTPLTDSAAFVTMSTTTTSSATTPTITNNQGSSPGGSNSPLLFFVALGFGVVFTNLWIIVGVKYCFRYNARNRARANGEEDENVDLQAMPRPHRRRREKKLMTMDEVNERFPLIKYKAWRQAREKDGLPATGGVTAPPSRAASIKQVETTETTGDRTSIELKELAGVDAEQSPSVVQSPAPAHLDPKTADPESYAAKHLSDGSMGENVKVGNYADQRESQAQLMPVHSRTDSTDEDEEDDDQIHNAVPPEMLSTPGDSCAICLDTLEDDEDVRGLTCGHAFHASCLDPWLTGRRACCPLCKADYYVPKPRPEGEAAQEPPTRTRTRASQPRGAAPPGDANLLGGRGLRRGFFPSRMPDGSNPRAENGQGRNRDPSRRSGNLDSYLAFEARRRSAAVPQVPSTENAAAAPSRGGLFSRLRFGRARNTEQTPADASATPAVPNQSAPSQVTPAQLEAGTR